MRSQRRRPSNCRSWRALTRGFTLIETMVAVACIAVLAALAMPSYNEHIRKARRTDAKNAVLELAGRQERFYSIHNRYAKTSEELGYGELPLNVQGAGGSYYQLSLDFLDGKGYTVRATPTGAQTKDLKCYAYVLTQVGAQSNVDSGDHRLTDSSCW